MTHVLASQILGSIPSPSKSSIDIGVELRAYGLMIGLGVIAAVWLLGKRLEERGIDGEFASDIGMWTVPAGLIGARLYHVITDWKSFRGRWIEAFYVWQGGLGIFGAIAAGALAGWWLSRKKGHDPLDVLDSVAPALPLAQAIGRLGNWWNQELYGRPTDLPWGLEIDEAHRVAGYENEDTFHPTFLYEGLWNLALIGFLIWLDRKKVLSKGRLFAVYVAGYSIGRLWIEAVRIDSAYTVAGLRVNLWVFGVLAIVSGWIAIKGLVSEEEVSKQNSSEEDVSEQNDSEEDEDIPVEDWYEEE